MCCSFFDCKKKERVGVVSRLTEILEDPPQERPYYNIQSSRELEFPTTMSTVLKD